jgi:hypothetical protein
MCPACMASAAAWIVGGTMSTSGITALAVRVLGNKKQRTNSNVPMAWVRHHDRYSDGYVVDPKQVYVQPAKVESPCPESEDKTASFDKLLKAI